MVNTISELLEKEDPFFKELIKLYKSGDITAEGINFVLNNKYKITKAVSNDIVINYNEDNSNYAQNAPLLSIIIPTFNRREMLEEAIHSILMQTYKNYEIIIIDDCSTDGTEQMLNHAFGEFKEIKYKKVPNSKDAGKNRNIGYNLAQGEYIVFLDDDDFYTDKNFFMKAINKHQEFNDLSFVCGNALVFHTNSKEFQISMLNINGLQESKNYMQNFGITFEKPKSTFTTVFNKNLLDKADLKNMMMMNDTPIYLRALMYGRVFILNDIVGMYRVHDNNISKNIDLKFIIKNLEEKLWVYKKIENEIQNPESWIIEQFMITIRYYIYGSNPPIKNLMKVIIWNNQHNKGIVRSKMNVKIVKNWIHNSFSFK